MTQPQPAPTPTRKIVHIAGVDNKLYVLCDDGSVWYLDRYASWNKLVTIPQSIAAGG